MPATPVKSSEIKSDQSRLSKSHSRRLLPLLQEANRGLKKTPKPKDMAAST